MLILLQVTNAKQSVTPTLGVGGTLRFMSSPRNKMVTEELRWMVLAGVVAKTEGGGGGGWRYRTVHALPEGGLGW